MKKIKKLNYKFNSSIKDISIPINIFTEKKEQNLKKPSWLKIKLPTNCSNFNRIKSILRKNNLNTVCEEASCPNILECFNNNSAAFMILGAICTRKCPFCDVKNGRPLLPDDKEPKRLAKIISEIKLNYVVITSVSRDDLRDGGAQHFVNCIKNVREKNPTIQIEILVPDFRGCTDIALKIISSFPPDVFNHNVENVPRLYKKIRPGANYKRSLQLLEKFKYLNPTVPTKSGLMLGLGETNKEILEVIKNLYDHGVTMLTIGQYLQPSNTHLPVIRYVSPKEFNKIKIQALEMGFTYVASGPFVRSSYYADLQAKGFTVDKKI